MKFYSTGMGRYLPPKGRTVECEEAVGERLIKKGVLVRTLEHKVVKHEVIREEEIPLPNEPVKRKGNPNWGKKK